MEHITTDSYTNTQYRILKQTINLKINVHNIFVEPKVFKLLNMLNHKPEPQILPANLPDPANQILLTNNVIFQQKLLFTLNYIRTIYTINTNTNDPIIYIKYKM